MPTRTTRQKRLARTAAVGASKPSFDAFLAILNDGRVELYGQLFDAGAHPSHAATRADLLEVARVLRGAGPSADQTPAAVRAWLTRTSSDLDAPQPEWVADPLLKDDTLTKAELHEIVSSKNVEIANLKIEIARRGALAIAHTFIDRLGPQLCLLECCTCARWFITQDDREDYCDPTCRPSRQTPKRSL